MTRISPALIGALLLCACSDDRAATPAFADQGSWTDATRWRVDSVPELTIAGSAGERLEDAPLDPTDVVRLSDGRYVVGDGNQSGWDALLVYDSAGKYLGRWGREGKGPGEFGQQYGVRLMHGDTIAGYDTMDRVGTAMGAYEIFSPTGEFVRQLPRPSEMTPTGPGRMRITSPVFGGLFPDGRFLMARGENVMRLPGKGNREVMRELEVFASGSGTDSVMPQKFEVVQWVAEDANYSLRPFAPRHHVVAGRTRWYFADSRRFAVRVFDRNGTELHTAGRNIRPARLTDQEKEEFILDEIERARYAPGGDGVPRSGMAAHIEQAFREKTVYAEFKALFSTVLEDSNENVWVEHFRWPRENQVPRKRRPTTWSVFDRGGKFLGEVAMPASFIVSIITENRVLGFYVDENDVKHVRVYRLCRPDQPCARAGTTQS